MVSEDYVLQFERRLFQIQREKRRGPPAQGTPVTVQKWLDGSVHFLQNNKELLVEEFRQRQKKQEEQTLSASGSRGNSERVLTDIPIILTHYLNPLRIARIQVRS